jgi:hypothetical protein
MLILLIIALSIIATITLMINFKEKPKTPTMKEFLEQPDFPDFHDN